MQQSTNTNGVQVVVLAQIPPTGTQRNSYGNMTSAIAQAFDTYGKTQIVIGSVCVIFQIVVLPLSNKLYGHGIWLGSLFIVTGVFGIFAGKKRGNCQVIAFQVLSIISASFALLMFCILAVEGALNRNDALMIIMDALLTMLSLVSGYIAIRSLVICFTMGACWRNCGCSCTCYGVVCHCLTDPQYQQFVNPLPSDVSQQQDITGNQQQPVLSTNQQQAMFNPNQQQQLPMFFPTQSMAGLYPQQYVTQLHAHPQNFSPNQPQPLTSTSLPETRGQETQTVDYHGATSGLLFTVTKQEASDDRSYEDHLICFNDSGPYPPPESPPPYDNDSGWNSHI